MAAPWEKYQRASAAPPTPPSGPWAKYGAPTDGSDGASAITDLPTVHAERPDFSGVTSAVDSTAFRNAPDGWEYGAGRDAAFGARSGIQAVGSLIGAVGGDAFNNYVANPIARQLGMQEARPYREEAAALADRIGLPKAQTSGDRIRGDVGEALAGTGLTLGIGGGINALAGLAPRAAQANMTAAIRS